MDNKKAPVVWGLFAFLSLIINRQLSAPFADVTLVAIA